MDKIKKILNKLFGKLSRSKVEPESHEHNEDLQNQSDKTLEIEIPQELKEESFNDIAEDSSRWSSITSGLGSLTSKFKLKQKAKAARSKKSSSSSSFNLDRLFQEIFSPETRPLIHKLFILSFITLTTYYGGKFAAHFLKLSPPKISKNVSGIQSKSLSMTKSQIKQIKTNDLFRAVGDLKKPAKPKPKVNKNIICKKAKKTSSLPITLVSTVVLQDSVKSIASVQVRGGKELLYLREGEEIKRMAKVGRINEKRLVFKNLSSGQCEYIESKEKKEKRLAPLKIERNLTKAKKIIKKTKRSGIVNKGNSFKIKKSLRDKLLQDMSAILTQARAVQVPNPNGTLSFIMKEIVPGSIFSNLNIQDNDRIDKINGKSINSLNEIMSQFGQLKTRNHYEITLRRGGQTINYEYDFVD